MTLARFIASGFGSGWAPKAPGTAGSLVGLALGAALLAWHPWTVGIAGAAAAIVGVWAIRRGAKPGSDPGWVVIDEIAGMLLALVPLGRPAPLGLLAAFALFRLFDIAKPGPVGWADRHHGPIAVMGDDVIAGLLAAAVLWLALWIEPQWMLG